MKPSVQANLAAFHHDARLYLTLGIANWSVFVDHIPNNVVNLLTLRNFGFSGAADLAARSAAIWACLRNSRL